MTAPSLRRRVRAEMIGEIKAVARRHLAADGANLSLRAVARDMGMVSSALYRYFAGRDELLTALIIDAYDAVGAAVEAADAAVDPGDHRGRLLAIARAAREWAVAHPAEYALIFGSPVPGYTAPAETIGPASRQTTAIVGVVRDAAAAGRLAPRLPDREMPPVVRDEMAAVARLMQAELPPDTVARTMLAWVQIYGLISFDLFGHFLNSVFDRAAFFDHQVNTAADLIGLP
ncbi:AcrR family transcriptional regulator [Catenuloplanes nepalensis]|uniref:AcrR family transcriptional regulator n=1 Tax=Catenuloplanes nepalensis TaxID=587533 RepID=A0ABT9N229_9ACTN|nr:TetR/AcrR family transcriptional regulator [Catenuloplanes nepalensis]MDP9797747.1 AcrR family transcriptional regulator [Catenuloplanes nepalensis]